MFKIQQRAVITSAGVTPPGCGIGDEVIVETTYDEEDFTSRMRIVGPAVGTAMMPGREAFRGVRARELPGSAVGAAGVWLTRLDANKWSRPERLARLTAAFEAYAKRGAASDKPTDDALRIDLPALRAAMKTIEAHAGLIDQCYSENADADNNASKMARVLRLIVDDEWRPSDAPRRSP